MVIGKHFTDEEILIDGKEFIECLFTRCRVAFRGIGPVRFEDCVFTECEWVFGGSAENTLFFLSALATDLGPEAASMVRNLLDGIETGKLDQILTKPKRPVAV
jgi:hypothetical protein